jgi:hypothetical protein
MTTPNEPAAQHATNGDRAAGWDRLDAPADPVNNRDGRAAGDALLYDVATAIVQTLRSYDVTVRWVATSSSVRCPT